MSTFQRALDAYDHARRTDDPDAYDIAADALEEIGDQGSAVCCRATALMLRKNTKLWTPGFTDEDPGHGVNHSAARPPQISIDTIRDDMKSIQHLVAEPAAIVAVVVVAPDVWERLVRLPVANREKLLGAEIRVERNAFLPPGTIVPIDAQGRPILKPRAKSPENGPKR